MIPRQLHNFGLPYVPTSSFLSYNGTCLTNCPANTVTTNDACIAYRTGCAACVDRINNCSSCQPRCLYYPLTNSYVLSCPYPKISNAEDTACRSCNLEYRSCTSVHNYSSCAVGYSLYNFACMLQCPAGIYLPEMLNRLPSLTLTSAGNFNFRYTPPTVLVSTCSQPNICMARTQHIINAVKTVPSVLPVPAPCAQLYYTNTE